MSTRTLSKAHLRPLARIAATAAVCCLLGLCVTPAWGAQELISLEILHDGKVIAVTKTPVAEPVTLQFELDGPVLAIYPETVALTGDAVRLAVYRVDDLRRIGNKSWIESVDVGRSGAVALERASDQLPAAELAVRLVGVAAAVER